MISIFALFLLSLWHPEFPQGKSTQTRVLLDVSLYWKISTQWFPASIPVKAYNLPCISYFSNRFPAPPFLLPSSPGNTRSWVRYSSSGEEGWKKNEDSFLPFCDRFGSGPSPAQRTTTTTVSRMIKSDKLTRCRSWRNVDSTPSSLGFRFFFLPSSDARINRATGQDFYPRAHNWDRGCNQSLVWWLNWINFLRFMSFVWEADEAPRMYTHNLCSSLHNSHMFIPVRLFFRLALSHSWAGK